MCNLPVVCKRRYGMISIKTIRVLFLCLTIIASSFDFGFSGLVNNTLIATRGGLVPIEKLKVGDKVLTYDLNETNPEETIIEVAVTQINKHLTDSVFTMYTTEDGGTESGWVEASPQQLFFTLDTMLNQ